MKRIILALAMIVLAGTTAFATTRATWTDTVTVTNNQVQTGTADLQVATTGGWDTTAASSSFVVSNLIPSSTPIDGGLSFWLRNSSTSPIAFSLTGQISPTGVVQDKTKLWIQVYDMDSGDTSAWATLAQWEATPQNLTSTLATGVQKSYGIRVELDPTALDEWQGKTVTFSLVVVGTQS